MGMDLTDGGDGEWCTLMREVSEREYAFHFDEHIGQFVWKHKTWAVLYVYLAAVVMQLWLFDYVS